MTPLQTKSVLIFGIIAGILSLPATWLTYSPANGMASAFEPWFRSVFGNPTIIVTGLSGRCMDVPLRLIVFFGIAANVMQLQRDQTSSVMRVRLANTLAMIGMIGVTLVVVIILCDNRDSIGVGAALAFTGATTAVASSFHSLKRLRNAIHNTEFARNPTNNDRDSDPDYSEAPPHTTCHAIPQSDESDNTPQFPNTALRFNSASTASTLCTFTSAATLA